MKNGVREKEINQNGSCKTSLLLLLENGTGNLRQGRASEEELVRVAAAGCVDVDGRRLLDESKRGDAGGGGGGARGGCGHGARKGIGTVLPR